MTLKSESRQLAPASPPALRVLAAGAAAPAETGYPFEEARAALLDDLRRAEERFAALPKSAAAGGLVLLKVMQHPERQREANFPLHLFKRLKLFYLARRRERVSPRRYFDTDRRGPAFSYVNIVAGRRRLLADAEILTGLSSRSRAGREMTCLERLEPLLPEERLCFPDASTLANGREGLFEVALYPHPTYNKFPAPAFRSYLKACGFRPVSARESDWFKENYLYLLIQGPGRGLLRLAEFSLIRHIRPARPQFASRRGRRPA